MDFLLYLALSRTPASTAPVTIAATISFFSMAVRRGDDGSMIFLFNARVVTSQAEEHFGLTGSFAKSHISPPQGEKELLESRRTGHCGLDTHSSGVRTSPSQQSQEQVHRNHT
ncbi:hypothetical protein VTO42DRAFT_7142 [Malbranchea cinnamomea]